MKNCDTMKRSKSERDSAIPIFQYFPRVSKISQPTPNEFYTQNLPKNDRSVETPLTSQVVQENEQLKKENKKLKNDLAALTKLYNQTCRAYVKKDLKIKLLEKRLTPEGLIFEKHKTVLGDITLKALRKIDGNRRADSSFILKCVKKLYETDLEKLKYKSGQSEITPDKKAFFKEILLERLLHENINEDELDCRMNRLNELLKNAITTLSRPKVRIIKQAILCISNFFLFMFRDPLHSALNQVKPKLKKKAN